MRAGPETHKRVTQAEPNRANTRSVPSSPSCHLTTQLIQKLHPPRPTPRLFHPSTNCKESYLKNKFKKAVERRCELNRSEAPAMELGTAAHRLRSIVRIGRWTKRTRMCMSSKTYDSESIVTKSGVKSDRAQPSQKTSSGEHNCKTLQIKQAWRDSDPSPESGLVSDRPIETSQNDARSLG